MNLMATSFIDCLSSANRTKAELPRPNSAIFTYLGLSLRGSGVVDVSNTDVGVLCVCDPPLVSLHKCNVCLPRFAYLLSQSGRQQARQQVSELARYPPS